jgi:hypothetical protein
MNSHPPTSPLHLVALALILAIGGCGNNTEAESLAPRAAFGEHTALPAAHPPLPVADAREVEPAGRTGAATARSVKVSVRVSPALRAQAAPGDALYIFARAARGPKMPLAIVRKQVKELPLTVTLDDSMAMVPDFRLSSFPEIVIGARISKSGDAIAKPGDLEGYTAPLRGDAAEVVIASVIGSAPKPAAGAPRGANPPAAFDHARSGGKSRLAIPAEVKAKWKAVEIAVTGAGIAARTLNLAVGGEQTLEHGLVLRVLAYVPAFQSDTGAVTSASNNPDNPAVLVQLLNGRQVQSEGWVFQKLADFNTFHSERVTLRLIGASG